MTRTEATTIQRLATTDQSAVATAASANALAVTVDGRPTTLPDPVMGAIRDILQRMARGETVTIGSLDSLLTTSQAADFLSFSRAYLCRLMDRGDIAYEYVGTHRRIRLNEVLRFDQSRSASQKKALDEVAEIGHQHDLYPDDF